MDDAQFADRLKGWFHPSQKVDGQVLWNHGDDLLPWEPVIEQYNWYRRIGRWLKPKRILEVGVAFGYGTLSMMADLEDLPEVWWLDNESGWKGSVGYGRIQMVDTYGADACPRWYRSWEEFPDLTIAGRFDLIHIDANHEYEHVLHDLQQAERFHDLYPHIICHDTVDPPVSRAIDDYMRGSPPFRTVEMPQVRCGVRVIHRCKGVCRLEEGLANL